MDSDNPVAFVQGMIGRAETEYLDFKGAGRISDRDRNQHWSAALSGFANSEGGVLLWGIRAARGSDPDDPSISVDVATELDLVPNARSFAQSLNDVLLEACVDPVHGIEVEPIVVDVEAGTGFVVCLIPPGTNKPHRASLDPAKQYYFRIRDKFTVIPHALLRAMFFPRIAPQLGVTFRPSSFVRKGVPGNVRHTDAGEYRFEVSVSNTGNASAHDLCVRIQASHRLTFGPAADFQAAAPPPNTMGLTFKNVRNLRAIRAVHPGEECHLGICTVVAPAMLQFEDPPDNVFRIQVEIFAQDVQPRSSLLEFNMRDFDDKVAKSTATLTEVEE